jgi:Kef-type K+ transport system membrane component KefB
VAIESAPVGAESTNNLTGPRLIVGYLVVAVLLAIGAGYSITAGNDETPAPAIAGVYASTADCLGGDVTLTQSGQFIDIEGERGVGGNLRLEHGRLTGDVECAGGGNAALDAALAGTGDERRFAGTLGGEDVELRFGTELAEADSAKPKKHSGEETFGRLMLAIAAVILAARLMGSALARVAQPRVMGEVLAGILLGPTLLGAVWPEAKDYLFPPDIVPLIAAASQIGLAFYLFLVGMELDPRILRERAGQAAFISNTSVAFPMMLGMLVALPIYELLAPDKDYLPFAIFMGVSMSITAFPVLARILIERRMLRRPVGALAMAGAAIDDVTAWALLAFATAIAGAGSGSEALVVIGLAGVFTAALVVVGRRLLARVSVAYDEVGHVPTLWITTIFVAVLLAAYTAREIGIAAIFGAFVVGLIMPRHAGLTHDVSRRIEDFVVIVLLPLFFVVTGLRTEINSLDRPILWVLTLVLIVVAIVGKWVGAMLAARYGGFSWRDSNAVGALMNTRGLTELIVLNIGLELGLISTALFTMLVLMALVTTFMAGPALRLIDPKGKLGEPAEDEFLRTAGARQPAAGRRTEGTILVAPQDDGGVDSLLALAEPLAASEPPRELVLARLIEPVAIATGVSQEDRVLERANEGLARRRESIRERGIEIRAVAFTSPDPGGDLVRLASQEDVDLVLINGRRPLLGQGIPRGEVGEVLAAAPCDVAVLVERKDVPIIDADHAVVVPFGGAEHDWAALELGAWIASARGAQLKLLGASAANGGGRDASRLLANASLVVQQLAGIAAEPVLVEPGPEVIRAAEGAGLLVVGLSEGWREEGLGPLRSEIVKSAPTSTLLVRRGERAGALAPKDNMTRFRWSSAGTPFGR